MAEERYTPRVMDSPPVRYATSPDGVRIAYTTFGRGSGTPVVVIRPPQFSHVQREWSMGFSHHEFELFAQDRMVIRFDPRGAGLSDRGVADQSLEARLSDLDAVVGQLDIEQFAIDSISSGSLVAMACAARHPDRVKRLIVQNAFADGGEWWGTSARRSLAALAEIDWSVCAETWAWLTFGSVDQHEVRLLATHIQACAGSGDLLRMVRAEEGMNLRSTLPDIVCPTLVLSHPRFSRLVPDHHARDLASAIPDARLATIESVGDRVAVVGAFLRGDHPSRASATAREAPDDAGALAVPPITAREIEVLRLLVGGLTNRAIAAALVVSVRTVDAHVSNIYSKLDVSGRAEAAAYAIRHGLA